MANNKGKVDTEVLTVTVPVGWCDVLTNNAREKGLNRSAYVRTVMLAGAPSLGEQIKPTMHFSSVKPKKSLE